MAFHFSSTGMAWERAFEGALRFLEEHPSGILLLGPSIGDSGRAWLEDRYLAKQSVRFGIRIQPWGEWVKSRARDRALSQGRGFRPLNQAGKREHLRVVARTMAEEGAFHHLGEIWSEERFFKGLLDCVTEARMAGLSHTEAFDRAKDLLSRKQGENLREAYEDFWNLLSMYEAFLAGGDGYLDEASQLRLAAEAPGIKQDLFLLGFEELSLLETELLQMWAKESDVFLPLPIAYDRLKAHLRDAIGDLDLPAELTLRGLLTGFTGDRNLDASEESTASPRRRLIEAHAPSEEARAAAALARAEFSARSEFRFVVPNGYFDDAATARPFREELGLPAAFHSRKALQHPISRLFFHLLEIKSKDYPLAQGLEIAKLLEFTLGKFANLAFHASRAGIRRGLADWKRKASQWSDPLLQEFAVFLEELDRLIPEKATVQDFATVTERAAKLVGIAMLAHPKRAPTLDHERDAHAALAGVLRNAQMLSAGSRGAREIPFSEWIAELKVALAGSSVGDTLSFFPKVQFYEYGEWLPPSGEGTLTIALGLKSGVGPSPGFQFFLDESARRRLSELLLPTHVQKGLGFLDQVKRVSCQSGPVLFSWSRFEGNGAEGEPHWVTGALDFERSLWPEIPRISSIVPFESKECVDVGDPGMSTFSASFFELYKECPFRAFAERVLRLEDHVQDSSLDLSRLEEGSFVHKALELFYLMHDGKNVSDDGERTRRLDASVEEAVAGIGREYFKGNERLFEAQVARLKSLLLEFLRLDAAQYARFPFFGTPELEKEVEGLLPGGHRWKGKIDRVDLDKENRRFLITDYKIGASLPANSEVQELRRFQLQLYMDAVERERPGWTAIGGTYASVTSGDRGTGLLRKEFNAGKVDLKPGEVKYYALGTRSGALLEAQKFDELRSRSRDETERLASQISCGNFSVTPADEETSCSRCRVRPACRIQELRSPPLELWPRPDPSALLPLLLPPPLKKSIEARERHFNPEQVDALDRRGSLVFIEASAGTGKTTVIVERIRRFLSERLKTEPIHLAVERFCAISFTEKSAQELAARLAVTLLQDSTFGPRVAAQAQAQVSTIHGFCRKLISDFPLEAGVSPLASMLDQKGAQLLRREVVEDFFLFPSEKTSELLSLALKEFTRAKIEEILLRLLDGRLLYREEIEAFRNGQGSGERIFPIAHAREVLLCLLDLSDQLAQSYEAKKRERHFLDFNDLEALALKVLENEHVRVKCRSQFELLLVDEFQDTNSLQREIFERLARPSWSNLFVVGDAKQSIYRFRAADVSVFQGLRREAEKSGTLVTLGRNYRSCKEIVEAANRITAAVLPAIGEPAPDFEAVNSPAIPELPAGGKVALIEYGEADQRWTASERRSEEAKLVANLVSELQNRPGPPLSIAVLLRKFSGNESYLRALTDAGISFRIGASKGFYGQALVTDSIALLRVLYGAKNDLALLAVLRSPWGRLSDRQLLEIARRSSDALSDNLKEEEAPQLFAWKKIATHASLSEILAMALQRYPQGRREHLQAVKLLSIIGGLEAEARPRAEILELLSQWSGWDQNGESSDDSIMPEPSQSGTVQVMTVHAAKGLEFDITILADLCGKLVPDNSALRLVRGAGLVLKLESDADKDPNTAAHRELGRRNKERELAELKRLFYVAVTRAKKEEYFLLPRSFQAVEKEKWDSCAHFLRAADLSGVIERYSPKQMAGRAIARSTLSSNLWNEIPAYNYFRSSSITEISDFNLCPEFHRLKNIQRWDDRIVEFWPKPKDFFRKKILRKNQPKDPDVLRVEQLLKSLKIERKERGIALHRVLERVKNLEEGLAGAGIWLREAYEAQGVSPEAPGLLELIAIDIDRLSQFLSSQLGREFFDSKVNAYPEIPFQWRFGGLVLHGAIDRLVQKSDGSWVVVDYKSSIQEQSLDDYRFQVASYMAAVRESEKAKGNLLPHVSGFLIDLFSASSIEVRSEHESALQHLSGELSETASNYTFTDTKTNLVESGSVVGGDHCMSCPYSEHCEIGVRCN